MLGHDLPWWVDTINRVYLLALILGAGGAIVIAATSWLIIKWQGEIQASKDREFAEYRIEAAKQTATLNAEAEKAKLETQRLKEQMAWRTLPPDMIAALKARLATQPGSVNIQHVANDPEAQYLAIQIANAFSEAKWQVAISSILKWTPILGPGTKLERAVPSW